MLDANMGVSWGRGGGGFQICLAVGWIMLDFGEPCIGKWMKSRIVFTPFFALLCFPSICNVEGEGGGDRIRKETASCTLSLIFCLTHLNFIFQLRQALSLLFQWCDARYKNVFLLWNVPWFSILIHISSTLKINVNIDHRGGGGVEI